MTRIGVLGTGVVGRTLAERFAELGHDVVVGSRTAKDDVVTFADAAGHGEIVVNATAGLGSVEALTLAGSARLAGKPLLDVSNALDHSEGFPPLVRATDRDSLAERIQAAFPDVHVVKALNTMNCGVMARPRSLPGSHNVFVAGDDEGAKKVVTDLLHQMGWADDEVLDLGDLTAARGLELYIPVWLRIAGALGVVDVQHPRRPRVSVGPWSVEATAGPPPAPAPRWGFRDVAIALGGALVLGTGFAVVLVAAGYRDFTPAGKAWATLALLVVPWILLGGWPLVASARKGLGAVRDFGLAVDGKAVLVGVAFGIAGLVNAATVASVQEAIMGHSFSARAADVAEDVAAGSHLALWIFALCTAFGAPIVEELAFRGSRTARSG